MESLEMLFKQEAAREIARYDRACEILASNLDRLKYEMQGAREDAIASLDRLLHEAKEAQIELRAKKAAFKDRLQESSEQRGIKLSKL